MNSQEGKFRATVSAVPTNIITGFLGVGKTTAIMHLLKSKPNDQRWAVLVNEFGEIGVDGSLFQGRYPEEGGIFVREVPGGCMCCAAGLPMQIALNQLLSKSKPHRLLIEPTGLGHPKEVLEVLTADHYREVLDIQKCVTLVDARKLSDSRYTTHDTFNQQIDIADLIVGNKSDLYSDNEQNNLINYIALRENPKAKVIFTSQGSINPVHLHGVSLVAKAIQKRKHHHHHPKSQVNINDLPFPDSGYLKVQNEGEGYQSVGWRFSPERVFKRKTLYNWLCGLDVERVKAVFITDEGVFGYNLTQDALTELEFDDCFESKIEIIAQQIDEQWEPSLMACLV